MCHCHIAQFRDVLTLQKSNNFFTFGLWIGTSQLLYLDYKGVKWGNAVKSEITEEKKTLLFFIVIVWGYVVNQK